MDEFKKFVEGKRGEFDLYDSNYDEIWNTIELKVSKPNSSYWGLKIAASIVLVCLVGGFAFISQTQSSEVPIELAEAEAEYMPLIAEKINMVKASYSSNDTLLWTNLNQIDKALLELREDLQDEADNEEVINAMIENYSIKLRILENILEEVKNEEDGESINI